MGQNPTKAASNIYCQKRKEAAKFAEKKQINTVAPENLTAVKYRVNRSNIMKVLDSCPELIRKNS